MIHIYDAILKLKNKDECKRFFIDLCTPKELKDFEDWWSIAQLLNEGNKSYREIAEEIKVSVTTIVRVARFLKDEQYQGYKIILNRIKK